MTHETGLVKAASCYTFPLLDEQADLVEKHKADSLLFCPNPWALRHVFINQETEEVMRARCNRWDCLYCGPRKVDMWRQLVKAAEPTLFLTLTKAGKTVEEAARALTTFLQYLRRGSKGKGAETASEFRRKRLHWHLLLKGVAYIPHEVLKEAWRSVRHGVAYIVHIEAIREPFLMELEALSQK